MNLIQPLAVERLRAEYQSAVPFPHLIIDGFLDPAFALEVANSFPSFQKAAAQGRGFETANEHLKVQVTDCKRFPAPVSQLNEALASQEFLSSLSEITGISELLADPALIGGGMHQTGARGRLDVHVDFNLIKERQLHRRLNLLLYLNPGWEHTWGGNVELWDDRVKKCHHSLAPVLNRCVIFETSDHSYHGVEAVTCPPNVTRKSFAGYYYTVQAPEGWNGQFHSTVFRARPKEKLKGLVLMPLERVQNAARSSIQKLKAGVRGLIRPKAR